MADDISYPQPAPEAVASPDASTLLPESQALGADVNLTNPEGQLVSVPQEQVAEALASGYSHSDPAALHAHFQQEDYGGAGQQAIAGLEGAAQGLVGPLAPAAERALGVSAEGIRNREEANPGTHLAGELAGFAGPAIISGGATLAGKAGLAGAAEAASAFTQAGVLGKAGEAIGAVTGLGGKGAGFVSQVGADAVKAAFETALYQGGDEVSKLFKEDPEQSAASAISHIGLAGVMGGVFGGALGAALRKTGVVGAEVAGKEAADVAPRAFEELPEGQFVSAVDAPKLAAGDFETTITHAENLTEGQKKGIFAGLKERSGNADAVEKFAEENNLPVHPGMITGSDMVKKATDSLIHGGPTYSGLATRAVYDEGFKGASGVVDGALGQGSTLSKAEIGNSFKEGLTSQIKEENQPIKEAYDRLKLHTEHIPLSLDASRIVTELEAMPEFRLAGSLPGGSLVKGAIEGLGKAQTVDDLKFIGSSIRGSLSPTAAPSERRVAALVSDKLKQLEEDSIEKFAKLSAKTPEDKAIAEGLSAARKEADAAYKPFIQKLQKLSKALGKENIGGTQGAIQFINNLTPEQVTSRLFAKNNSQFLKFFDKEFPEQAAQMRAYQKGVLRDAATKEGVLSPKDLFNRINKLEPEIQESIFTKAELKKLQGAETYLRSFPKDYNPSGTSGMYALRDMFTSPLQTISANVRDKGIDTFIKTVAASPRASQASELGKAAVSGNNMATKAIKSLFSPGKDTGLASVSTAQRAKLSSLVDSYQADPSKMLSTGDNNPVPAYAQAFATTTARAVQYLSTLKPNTQPARPLDPKPVPSAAQTSAYNRALDIAQQPLTVLAKMKQGTLTPNDILTLKTIYPSVYQGLSQKMMNSVMEATNKGNAIPYATRLQMSMFLGQPLDSTMTQPAIAAIQAKPAARQEQQPPQGGVSKKSASGLDKLATGAQTALQSRESHRAK